MKKKSKRRKKIHVEPTFETVEEFMQRGGAITDLGLATWTKSSLLFSNRHFRPNKRTRGRVFHGKRPKLK